MTKVQKFSFTLIAVILATSIGFYYYRHINNSYVLIFAKTNQKKLISYIRMLKNADYAFMDSEQLHSKIKSNKPFKRKTVVLVLKNEPTASLSTFLKSNRIPAIFLSDEPPKIKLASGQSIGLRVPSASFAPISPRNGFVSIDFDDGYISVKRNALPVLNKKGFAASAFIISQKLIEGEDQYLKVNDIRDLQSAGWEVGSHGADHVDFSKLNDEQLIGSLASSKKFLESYGMSVYGFAFPYGDFVNKDLEAAKSFYRYSRTSEGGFNMAGSIVINSTAWRKGLPLSWYKEKLDYAKKKKIGVTFVFHGVDNDPSTYFIEKNKFAQFIKMIKKSGMPVYSRAALFGKSVFLRQEYGNRIEREQSYKERVKKYFTSARRKFGTKEPEIIYYPGGVVTNQIVEVARQLGFKIGFGNNFGYLTKPQNALNLKTIYISGDNLEELLGYRPYTT